MTAEATLRGDGGTSQLLAGMYRVSGRCFCLTSSVSDCPPPCFRVGGRSDSFPSVSDVSLKELLDGTLERLKTLW